MCPLEQAIQEVQAREQHRQALKKQLTSERGNNLSGIQLANRSNTLFAIMLPDAAQPGRFRASFFDVFGFSGHITRDSYFQILDELMEDGYVVEAPEALRTVSRQWN